MRTLLVSSLFLTSFTTLASAHVGVSSGPAFADKTQKISFGVGHGCHIMTPTGEVEADTYKVRIEIPEGVTGIRVLSSDFGKPTIEKTNNVVTAITWQKPLTDLHDSDIAYYSLDIRARISAPAFSQVEFKIHQTCRTTTGQEQTVSWQDPPGLPDGNPIAQLTVVPARVAGWNKYTLVAAVPAADLAKFFADAAIVWRGSAAYSSNQHTAAMIASTPGVTALAGDLAVGDVVWVKY